MAAFLPFLGTMFGSEFARNAIGPAMGAVGSGNLFGTQDRQFGNRSSTDRFDRTQLPFLNEQLAQTDLASARFAEMIRQLNSQRMQQLQGNLDQQMNAVQGLGQQAMRDINQRYDSRQGGVGQTMANRGLYNSTVAPGMRALVERERNNALGQEQDRQRQYFGGLLGQRAMAMDQVSAGQNQALQSLGAQDYGLRAIVPQQIASSRISNARDNTVTKRGGIFSRLFG